MLSLLVPTRVVCDGLDLVAKQSEGLPGSWLAKLTSCRLLAETNSLRRLFAEALVILSRPASYVCVDLGGEFVYRVGTRCRSESALMISQSPPIS